MENEADEDQEVEEGLNEEDETGERYPSLPSNQRHSLALAMSELRSHLASANPNEREAILQLINEVTPSSGSHPMKQTLSDPFGFQTERMPNYGKPPLHLLSIPYGYLQTLCTSTCILHCAYIT